MYPDLTMQLALHRIKQVLNAEGTLTGLTEEEGDSFFQIGSNA